MTNSKELTPSAFAKEFKIPMQIVEEVRIYSEMGWAKSGGGQPVPLNPNQMKLIALFCHKSGLSLAGKQVLYLGDSLYVTKSGKISIARKDERMPLINVKVRPATKDERTAYGLLHNKPGDAANYEHLHHAEIYAMVDGSPIQVSNAFGHACLGNIKLHKKGDDPRRLCADMAATRAVSRALSQTYDFFGAESYEEIILTKDPPRETINTTAEVVEGSVSDQMTNDLKVKASHDEKVEVTKELTPKDIITLLEQNKDKLPSEMIEGYPESRLEKYAQEGLQKVYGQIKEELYKISQASSKEGKSQEETSEGTETESMVE